MRRLGVVSLLLLLVACNPQEGVGERCNPMQFESNCADGLSCVYPTAPNCGVSYCCAVDSNGNITDKNPNCQPDPSLISVCMLDLGVAPVIDLGVTPLDGGTKD
jgi:hypothetical protein